ncbi:class I SAM-dependent methyltransferase [Epilithonimonas ginsengisoli]|uniref:Class I SAM-dependent methyltransferase n=1 Tax=Epilithonimonas ginsengisoli TaxID=1245592 RepID=A0ABU4JIT6_9FLAO|nr:MULTISPECIES: class I SAM-dependent methyltransferase [Chryseobacterium group]MBV6880845.1 RsmD family RNA methyltransferase [Epilithonimonas sp. FP105]MDW8549585.1 class I SAM-dependent methyltransferase [Epilithonimonas ginsengisoli]OAH76715.1 methyltransferase [Chryseobacterium sp. FP211-J200]
MDFTNLLAPEVQAFINQNIDSDITRLLLKKSPFPNVTMQEIIQQIKGKKVAQRKFAFLLKDNLVFPPNLNLEQASSQSTAEYKAQTLKGNSFLDLTSGFGIDAYFLSQNFEEVTLVEQNPGLIKIVEHNWKTLNREANFINQNLEEFLEFNKEKFDVIYLDPARRDQNNKKKFLLEDLSPNLLEIQEKLSSISDKIIVKLSPLIDISYLVSELQNINEVKIIAVRNEVKELVLIIDTKKEREKSKDTKITCVNLESDEPEFSFYINEEKIATSEFSESLNYLYIPNNSILKAGAFNIISEKFGLKKLHPNTHFYTSENKIEHFPGRILQVEKIDGKELKKNDQFNIISKNYPLKPDEIKKKYKLKDGGNRYLIFTQSIIGKEILRSR